MGGFPYRGWASRDGGTFVGHRPKKRGGFDFIVSLSGANCNFFIFELLINSFFLKGIWRMTRLDLEFTLDYEFLRKRQLKSEFRRFHGAQTFLEEKTARFREVSLILNQKYALVNVGLKKNQQAYSWKVYTSGLEDDFPAHLGVRFEVTIKNPLKYLNELTKNEGNIEKCNYFLIKKTLLEAADTPLLLKHRYFMKNWSVYHKSRETVWEDLLPPENQKNQSVLRRTAQERKNQFQAELTQVSLSLNAFAELLKTKKSILSHKQISLLNQQFRTTEWRLSWNRHQQWALVPTKINPLWGPLFKPLPKKAAARRKAVTQRKKALKLLAAQFDKAVLDCNTLKTRKVIYVEEPKSNKIIREIFEVLESEKKIMDKKARQLPRAQSFYTEEFSDKPIYVQEIILNRWREKQRRKRGIL